MILVVFASFYPGSFLFHDSIYKNDKSMEFHDRNSTSFIIFTSKNMVILSGGIVYKRKNLNKKESE
jgi:hypothetical protein